MECMELICTARIIMNRPEVEYTTIVIASTYVLLYLWVQNAVIPACFTRESIVNIIFRLQRSGNSFETYSCKRLTSQLPTYIPSTIRLITLDYRFQLNALSIVTSWHKVNSWFYSWSIRDRDAHWQSYPAFLSLDPSLTEWLSRPWTHVEGP